MSFLKAVRGAADVLPTTVRFDAASNALKVADSGISSIDSIFRDLPTTHINNIELGVNTVPWRDVAGDFRLAELNTAFRKMELNTISPADQLAFKNIIEPTVPEFQVKAMNENIANANLVHSDLRVTAETGPELQAQLNTASQAKVESSWTKIKTAVGVGGTAIGIIAAVVVGSNMWQSLVEATNQRNGCFITSKVNGKTSSCKIMNRSCMNQNGSNACGSNSTNLVDFNIYLFAHNAVNENDQTTLAALGTLGVTLTSDNINTVLNDAKQVQIMYEYYQGLAVKPPIANPCGTVVTGCIACDTSAQINSATFVSDVNLADNMTIQCITNSNVLETLVDVGTGLGIDIFGSITDSLSGSFSSQIWIILGIIVVGLVILGFFFKFSGSSGGSKNNGKVIEINAGANGQNSQYPNYSQNSQYPTQNYAPTTLNY